MILLKKIDIDNIKDEPKHSYNDTQQTLEHGNQKYHVHVVVQNKRDKKSLKLITVVKKWPKGLITPYLDIFKFWNKKLWISILFSKYNRCF